jgi:hypothetical protein
VAGSYEHGVVEVVEETMFFSWQEFLGFRWNYLFSIIALLCFF